MSVTSWGFSESCIHPLTIVSTYLLHQGDSYSGHAVNFSEASDKAAIKKEWGKVDINAFGPKVDFLPFIHAKQLR